MTEGNSSSPSLTLSMEVTPGLSSQSLTRPEIQAELSHKSHPLVGVVDEVGEEEHRDAHQQHPHDAVKEVFSIHKIPDAMDCGFLINHSINLSIRNCF